MNYQGKKGYLIHKPADFQNWEKITWKQISQPITVARKCVVK